MTRSEAIVIGGGQAGLAMSRCLASRGVEHVVLERGRIGQRWRDERWESLRLLTPNWMTRLPGWSYRGPDPDGYMAMQEVADFLEAYGAAAPVVEQAEVASVARDGGEWRVETQDRSWRAAAVVVATGHCQTPRVPEMAHRIGLLQVTPATYRRPELLPAGGVLVVGASASGVQLAEEIQRSGRQVTLSVGQHTRMPRLYRGRDVLWWLDRAGILAEPADRRRVAPSFQLVGRSDRRSVDLASLHALGVRIAGRAVAAAGGVVSFRDDLAATTAAAQRRMERVLDRVDAIAGDGPADAAARRPVVLPPGPTRLDLKAEGIRSVVWAVGYRRAYPWLHAPVLDGAGEILHHGGVTAAPGLYVLGLPNLRRRNSSFLDGVGADAAALAAHLHAHLAALAA